MNTRQIIPACIALALTCTAQAAETLKKINHIVVIYGENRSFDNLYGLFPGANGIAEARSGATQVDTDGRPLPTLPPVWAEGKPGTVDPQFAGKPPLANGPFRLDQPPYSLPPSVETRDLVHKFYQSQEQIDGGKNDRFAAISDAGGLALGYYDGSSMKMWKWAREYTLADNFFMAAFGGSFLNHMWLACACTPVFPGAPEKMIAKLNPDGVTLMRAADSPASALQGPPKYVNDGPVTPDFYAVNTMQAPYQPSKIPPTPDGDPRLADPAKFPLPPQTQPTIGDRLSARGVSWAWYSGAWNEAVADGMQPPEAPRKVIYNRTDGAPNFQVHHQPYNFFANYAPGTEARAAHLKDEEDLLKGIKAGKLPQVVFYKPTGRYNQHPGYADVTEGDEHIAEVVERIRHSALWKETLIIVTYDENGGLWDHVAPPKGDRWGPGTRIPAILISPYVKRGFVDHSAYDTTSILKLLTRRFELEPLPGVRAEAGDLTAALQ